MSHVRNRYCVCVCVCVCIYIYIRIYIYCDERPEASSASPWKQARNTCPSSSQADRSQLQLITRRLHEPRKPYHKWDTSPWDWAFTHPLISLTDSSAWPTSPTGAPHGLTALEGRRRALSAPKHPRRLFPCCTTLLCNKSTLRGHLLSNPCRVIPHPVTLVENAGILVKNHRQASSFTLPFLFCFFVSGFCHRRALLTQHGWNPPAAHRG